MFAAGTVPPRCNLKRTRVHSSAKRANAFHQARRANAFGQACKRVPCIAFVHVNAFANAFALACEQVCLHLRTRLAWRANAFETRVRYTLHLGGTVV